MLVRCTTEFSVTFNGKQMFKRREHRELESRLIEAWIENFFLKKKVNNMEKATAELIRAVKNKGPVPQYHSHVMKKHREEWPALWKAIDSLTEAYYLREKE